MVHKMDNKIPKKGQKKDTKGTTKYPKRDNESP